MIVKTLRHKRDRFAALVRYILSDQNRVRAADFDTIYHNFHAVETPAIIAEFKANDRFRKSRKNGVVAYHEILSFAPEDKAHLAKAILYDLAQEYIRLRGEQALCLVQAHVEHDHVHLHFLFSGNHYRSAKTLRLDNKNFRKVRQGIETYQRQHYPKLKASLVYDRWDKSPRLPRSVQGRPEQLIQLEKRQGKGSSTLSVVKTLIASLTADRPSQTVLEKRIKQHRELEIYHYRHQPKGVLYRGKKYRFQRLGIDWTPEINHTPPKTKGFDRDR